MTDKCIICGSEDIEQVPVYNKYLNRYIMKTTCNNPFCSLDKS